MFAAWTVARERTAIGWEVSSKRPWRATPRNHRPVPATLGEFHAATGMLQVGNGATSFVGLSGAFDTP